MLNGLAMTKFSKCVVSYCGHCQQRDKECIYAKFPKDIERCRKWLKVVGNTDLPYLPPAKLNEIRYVCGCHFTDDQFSNSTRKRLKKTAVPSLIDARIIPCNDDLINQYPLALERARTPAVALQEVIHVTNEHETTTTTSKTSPAIVSKAQNVLSNTARFVEPIAQRALSVMETVIETVPEIVSAVTPATSRHDMKKAADVGACGLKRYRESEQFLRPSEYRYKRIGNDALPISTSASIVDITLDNKKVSYVAKSLDTKPLRMAALLPYRDENFCVNRTTLCESSRGTKARSKEHIAGTSRKTSYFTTTSPLSSPSRSNQIQRISVMEINSVPRKNKINSRKNIHVECMSTDPAESRIFLPQHGSKYDEFGLYTVQCLKKLNPVLADNVVSKIKEILNGYQETR